jgi:crotonobetainyl-CoA:carnitine CoA-transferase CaiB-like acyl-CoA transferase
MVEEVEGPGSEKVKQVGIAVKLSDTPGKIMRVAPLPGENTTQILRGLGYDDDNIKKLRSKGVIG